MTEIDRPDVVAEVAAAFERYEAALVANDVDVLDDMFWHDARVVRYGLGDVQHGWDEVSAFRRGLQQQTGARKLVDTVIHAFGTDAAVVATEFVLLDDPDRRGRQSQTWARVDGAWRVVAAHVSLP
jgi:hypothetical protein